MGGEEVFRMLDSRVHQTPVMERAISLLVDVFVGIDVSVYAS